MEKRIIVVLGMPCSGTRVLTRGLEVLGVELGDFLKPAPHGVNKNDIFEDEAIAQLNEDILKKMGQPLDGSPVLIDGSRLLGSGLKNEKKKAVALLSERTQDANIFGFRDSKITSLLPFWQKVFKQLELDDSYLIALRNPYSVACSLNKRNGMTYVHSFLLWMGFQVDSIRETRKRLRVIVDYDKLLDSPMDQLKRIAKALKLPPPEEQAKELDKYTREYLNNSLRHHFNDLRKTKMFRSLLGPPMTGCSSWQPTKSSSAIHHSIEIGRV